MIEDPARETNWSKWRPAAEARFEKHPHLPTHFDVRAIRYQRKGDQPRILLTFSSTRKQYSSE
ncbi:MAG: hypothetical protein IPI49_28995 [Myxococcales bacterium]|nr:hypothetical protein [Myxococcales bacterium]